MRSRPPHPLVRYRIALLAVAIAAWALPAALSLFKTNYLSPAAFAVGAIAFTWSNVVFWWLELRYPHIKLASGQYASRTERGSRLMRVYSNFHFAFIGVIAITITIACIRDAASAYRSTFFDPLTFDQARQRASEQASVVTLQYEEAWYEFNNAHLLEEKGGCYAIMPDVTTQQVLVLDATGRVIEVVADVNNNKAQCFRESYLNIKFPRPPFAPYYIYLKMLARNARGA